MKLPRPYKSLINRDVSRLQTWLPVFRLGIDLRHWAFPVTFYWLRSWGGCHWSTGTTRPPCLWNAVLGVLFFKLEVEIHKPGIP